MAKTRARKRPRVELNRVPEPRRAVRPWSEAAQALTESKRAVPGRRRWARGAHGAALIRVSGFRAFPRSYRIRKAHDGA